MKENSYNRILGVDYGSHSVGLALSDPLAVIARPIQTLKNDAELISKIKEIVNQENVTLIVVGMPYNLKGQQAQKALETQKFIDMLKLNITTEVITWDERFTTVIAQRTVLSMGMKKKQRQKKDGKLDSMAAALILQGYLDNKKNQRCC